MEKNIRDSKNKRNTENTNKRYMSPRPAASAAETDEEWERRREARRRRRLLQRKRERRKKLMILAGTAVVSVAVIAGGIRGITGFISSRNNDSAQKTTADNKNAEGTGTGETKETKETQSKGADVLAEAELKAAQEKLTQSAQKVFAKMYEQAQAAQGAAGAGPDMNAGTSNGADDDVIDADFKEV